MKLETWVLCEDCDGHWAEPLAIVSNNVQILIRPCKIDGIFMQLDPEVLRPTTTMVKPETKENMQLKNMAAAMEEETSGRAWARRSGGTRRDSGRSSFKVILWLLVICFLSSQFTIFVNVGRSSASSFAHWLVLFQKKKSGPHLFLFGGWFSTSRGS